MDVKQLYLLLLLLGLSAVQGYLPPRRYAARRIPLQQLTTDTYHKRRSFLDKGAVVDGKKLILLDHNPHLEINPASHSDHSNATITTLAAASPSTTTTTATPFSTVVQNTLVNVVKGKAVLIATFCIFASALLRKKLTKLDLVLYLVFSCGTIAFKTAKCTVQKWSTRLRSFRDAVVRHSRPIDKNYFLKNDNAADRVTLLGVAVNIALSIVKLIGGIAFNSAVLVADAGHSLSDLFSDFITLWAVQIARIPADSDHPYGHGKFESIGSLFLSLTLIATGLSVGTWSYGQMVKVLVNKAHKAAVKIPTWPALGLALFSILSKEWLFRITKKVGEKLNSQLLVANAWHHRSDAFSSIMALVSIAAAIYLPGLVIADSAAGILIAGMILLTGLEVLVESVKQLTDSSDEGVVQEVLRVVQDKVHGVRGIKDVRARSVGSGSLVDMTILIDMKLSTSAAHAIAEQIRWKVIDTMPHVVDVLVRTQGADSVLCPLLSKDQRSIDQMEANILDIIAATGEGNEVPDVKRITLHYIGTNAVNAEVVLSFDSQLSLEGVKAQADLIKQAILRHEKEILQVDIQLDLGGDSQSVA